jgi:hypothetical protein
MITHERSTACSALSINKKLTPQTHTTKSPSFQRERQEYKQFHDLPRRVEKI